MEAREGLPQNSQPHGNELSNPLCDPSALTCKRAVLSLPSGAERSSGRVTFRPMYESLGASEKDQLVTSALGFSWSCCPEDVGNVKGSLGMNLQEGCKTKNSQESSTRVCRFL